MAGDGAKPLMSGLSPFPRSLYIACFARVPRQRFNFP